MIKERGIRFRESAFLYNMEAFEEKFKKKKKKKAAKTTRNLLPYASADILYFKK